MRVLEINNDAVDLQAQVEPFTPGNSMVALNGSAEQRVIQQANDAAFTDGVETVATLAAAGAAGAVQNITPTKRYIRTSAAADPVSLLAN